MQILATVLNIACVNKVTFGGFGFVDANMEKIEFQFLSTEGRKEVREVE